MLRGKFVIGVLLPRQAEELGSHRKTARPNIQPTRDSFIDPIHIKHSNALRTMGSRDWAMLTALASHRCGLGSIPARCHMWIEYVVGSRLAPRYSLQNLTRPNSKSTSIEHPHENQLRLMWLAV